MRRFIDVQEERVAPPALVRQLRDIDPTAELVYVGHGEWWLGCVRPNHHRLLTGWKAARHELERPFFEYPSWRFARLLMQGFAFCGAWYFEGEPTSKVVEEFRVADWMWRHQQAVVEAEVLDRASGDARHRKTRMLLRERTQADARWIHRRLVQQKRTVYSFPSARM